MAFFTQNYFKSERSSLVKTVATYGIDNKIMTLLMKGERYGLQKKS